MLKKKNRLATDQVEFVCLSELVPKNHLLRAVDASINFDFIYDEVKDLYSDSHGRPSIDPVVLIKLIMLQALFGIPSMRQTIRETEVNLAYRWFLGYGLQEKVPHFSTFGKNYERRFKESDLFEKIFEQVLTEALQCGFLKADAVFIDATHVKANANRNKYVKKMARHRAHKYKRDLLMEINEDRIAHGKKPFENHKDGDGNDGSPISEVTPVEPEKQVKESTTDPESGLFVKGEKERCFAYTASVACDQHGFVLGVQTAPGNVHDSQIFTDVFAVVNSRFPEVQKIVADSGYKTPGVCREIIQAEKWPVMPYRRPMTPKGYFKKYEYVYDEHYDCYLCPNDQVLWYSTTNREGYREYKSDPAVCIGCPKRMQCTKSKNCTKVVTRHVWEGYLETAEDIRHTEWGRDLYRQRGQTIERVFADAKERHGMRNVRYRGLRKVHHYLTLVFACMNLKKLARWKQKTKRLPPASLFLRAVSGWICEKILPRQRALSNLAA